MKINQLLDRGLDSNFADEHGNTAILEAARAGDYDVVNMLIFYNVNMNAKTKYGSTVETYFKEN